MAVGLASALSRPLRYAPVGVVCAAINNLGVIGLSLMKWHYLLATVTAGALSLLVGFLLHCGFTFTVAPSWRRLVRYLAGVAGGWAIALSLMVVLCDGAGLNAMVAMPATTVLMFAWHYLAARWALTATGKAAHTY